MKQIKAYETSDGRLFYDYARAKTHQDDVIEEMLDDLVANDARGNVTRSDRYSILTTMRADPNLRSKIAKLHHALEHGVVE